MDPSLRLAVELPPVPAAGPSGPASLEPWWQMVDASVRAGAGVVWFRGGPSHELSAGEAPEEPAGRAAACDACTIAGAAVSRVDSALLGVVSGVPVDRHPAILARDVTALDVVSGGRAAVLLRWAGAGVPAGAPGGPAGDLSAACAHLGEAIAVCRAVLQDDDPIFEGRYLHVAGAVNRPGPRRPGGPPLLVEVPAGAAGLARREAGPVFLLRQAVSTAAAVVCPDDPGEIASWRALIEDTAATLWTRDAPDGVAAVVCRTTLQHEWTDGATRRGTDAATAAAAAPARGALRSRLDAARAAGADGVIVRMPSSRRSDATLPLEPADVERVAGDLLGCFAPWRS